MLDFNKTPQEIITDLKKFKLKAYLKSLPNSVLFWNAIIYLSCFSLLLLGGQNGLIILITLSTLSSGALIIMVIQIDDLKHHLWIYLTFYYWTLILCFIVLFLVLLFDKHLLKPFNNFLDKK